MLILKSRTILTVYTLTVSIHLKKLQSQECTNRISTKTLFTGPCDISGTLVYIGRFWEDLVLREVPFSITLLINWVIL